MTSEQRTNVSVYHISHTRKNRRNYKRIIVRKTALCCCNVRLSREITAYSKVDFNKKIHQDFFLNVDVKSSLECVELAGHDI